METVKKFFPLASAFAWEGETNKFIIGLLINVGISVAWVILNGIVGGIIGLVSAFLVITGILLVLQIPIAVVGGLYLTADLVFQIVFFCTASSRKNASAEVIETEAVEAEPVKEEVAETAEVTE